MTSRNKIIDSKDRPKGGYEVAQERMSTPANRFGSKDALRRASSHAPRGREFLGNLQRLLLSPHSSSPLYPLLPQYLTMGRLRRSRAHHARRDVHRASRTRVRLVVPSCSISGLPEVCITGPDKGFGPDSAHRSRPKGTLNLSSSCSYHF